MRPRTARYSRKPESPWAANPSCGSWLIALVLALAVVGCKHKPTAKEREYAAYLAGQRQAFTQVQEAQRTSIRIIGNVQNHELDWTNGLTLAHAIIAAQSSDHRNPREIVIIRQGERISIDPHDLLQGDDFLLTPGDTVEIHP